MSRPRLIALLLALVTLLLYLPVRHADFLVYDDNEYVTENHIVQQGLTGAGLHWAFGFHASNWHPVTWLSHMLDCQLFGLDPGAPHLVNALLHALNAALLFGLLLRLTGRCWPAAAVAALFAWHPLHVESVAWVAERKDVLSMFFGLLALIAYTRYVAESKVRSPKSKVFYACVFLLFALGLMSKPMLVTLPFVMLLLDWWPLGRFPISDFRFPSLGRLVVEKVPFFLLAAVSCVLTYQAQRGEAVVSFEHVPFGARLENAVVAYASYLSKTILPVNLAVFYPLQKEIPLLAMVLSAVLLVVISTLVWRARTTKPYLLFGWLWFLGTLMPVIGLVQVGGQAMADRYTYLPLVGVFIMAAFGFADLAARWRLQTAQVAVLTGLALGGCLMATARQLAYWHDSVTLFSHTLAVTPDNPITRINLGVALERAGQPAQALKQYEQALQLDPHRSQAHNNLGTLLDVLGRTDEALEHYRAALQLKPDAPLTHANLGTLLVKLGRFDEAMSEYADAARLLPDDPRPHYLMGKAELKRGNSPAAIAHFRDALRRAPDDFQSLTFLARTLASDNDPQVRNGAEAMSLAARANELTAGSQPFVLDTLAMAQAEAGQFKDAAQTTQRALDICAAAGETNSPPDLRKRLDFYQAGRPWRESPTNSAVP